MSTPRKLVPNVHEFLQRAADDYGKIKREQFAQDIYCELVEGKISSPIEDLFFIACQVLCVSEYIYVNPEAITNESGEPCRGHGVFISPQVKAGKFTVDFVVSQNGLMQNDCSGIVVELDGHDFHDKDKTQRAYEKARDRFLVKSGYKVLHFTGSEVVADPYRVAFEVLLLAGVFLGSDREEYDEKNPLGIL